MMIQSVRVLGDSGRPYDITVGSGGQARCSCPAFRFAGECKHIRFVIASLARASEIS